MGRKKKGLCTKWVETINISQQKSQVSEISLDMHRVSFSINPGSFPNISLNDYAIIIATGTGIAPFRNLLFERFNSARFLKYEGSVCLFYGCRNKTDDFLYGDEFQMFKNCSNMNFDYNVAFSRDQKEKIYVQHLIKEKWEFIYDIVFVKRCYVFIVGNSKVLPKSIDNALKHVFCQKNKDMEKLDEEWNKILYALKKSGRFYIETW